MSKNRKLGIKELFLKLCIVLTVTFVILFSIYTLFTNLLGFSTVVISITMALSLIFTIIGYVMFDVTCYKITNLEYQDRLRDNKTRQMTLQSKQ